MCGLWLFAGWARTKRKKWAPVFFYLGHTADDTRMMIETKFRRCSISFEIRCKVQWWRDDVDKMKRWRDIRRALPFSIWVTWLMWRWCFFYLGHLAVRHKLMKVSHGQMWCWQAIPMTNMIIWGPNWKMWWHEMVIWMIWLWNDDNVRILNWLMTIWKHEILDYEKAIEIWKYLVAMFGLFDKSCLSDRLISGPFPPSPQLLNSFQTQSTFEDQRSTFWLLNKWLLPSQRKKILWNKSQSTTKLMVSVSNTLRKQKKWKCLKIFSSRHIVKSCWIKTYEKIMQNSKVTSLPTILLRKSTKNQQQKGPEKEIEHSSVLNSFALLN